MRGEMNEAVAIIGLGIMGGSIARNLKLKGRIIRGFDIDPAARRRSAENGVEVTEDVRSAVAGSAIILTSPPSFKAPQKVIGEIVEAATPGCIIVELSTFSLAEKASLRDEAAGASHILIDCPLSGTGAQAKTGDVVVYASGDDAAIGRCTPIF